MEINICGGDVSVRLAKSDRLTLEGFMYPEACSICWFETRGGCNGVRIFAPRQRLAEFAEQILKAVAHHEKEEQLAAEARHA
jgi:hypothetical protein